MKLRLSTLLLMLSTTFAATTALAENQSLNTTHVVAQISSAKLDALETITYDLGSNLAVIFYYNDTNGDRLVVTTIGPKDPDSGVAGYQQILKANPGSEFTINIGSDESVNHQKSLTASFKGNELVLLMKEV